MSKKALIERQQKRKILVNKYFIKRKKIKEQIKKEKSLQKVFQIQLKLQKLPRNSSQTRLNNRCLISGRSRGFFRNFQLSRHFLREMALSGLLPGIQKASW